MMESLPRQKPNSVQGKYRYTKRAQQDLIEIYIDTVRRWGVSQADIYQADIKAAVELLADHPNLGRECSEISKGLRRHEHKRHIVFYRKRSTAIAIIRIIHRRMDAKRQV